MDPPALAETERECEGDLRIEDSVSDVNALDSVENIPDLEPVDFVPLQTSMPSFHPTATNEAHVFEQKSNRCLTPLIGQPTL